MSVIKLADDINAIQSAACSAQRCDLPSIELKMQLLCETSRCRD